MKERTAEGINKYPTQFLSSPFDPLVPESKGTWTVGFAEFRFSGHRTKQRKMENRIPRKMEYNHLLAFKSWGHLYITKFIIKHQCYYFSRQHEN